MTSVNVIKGVHSVIFLSLAASILYTLYSGLTGRMSRLTGISTAAVMGEGLVLVLNDMRCPLTDLAEDLGSDHGSVSDIFLPRWFADRIPVLFSPPFAIGLVAIAVRIARRKPILAASSAIIAGLFLGLPWVFLRRELDQGKGIGRAVTKSQAGGGLNSGRDPIRCPSVAP